MALKPVAFPLDEGSGIRHKFSPLSGFCSGKSTEFPVAVSSVSFPETFVICKYLVAGEGKGNMPCDVVVSQSSGENSPSGLSRR